MKTQISQVGHERFRIDRLGTGLELRFLAVDPTAHLGFGRQKNHEFSFLAGFRLHRCKNIGGRLAGADNIEGLKAGARVEANPEKKGPTDFALWKFSPAGKKRQMEWPSPWGVGFPPTPIPGGIPGLNSITNDLNVSGPDRLLKSEAGLGNLTGEASHILDKHLGVDFNEMQRLRGGRD